MLIIFILLIYAMVMIQITTSFRGLLNIGVSNEYKPATTISVIVAARNEENALPGCLGSMMKMDYPDALLEIIVVDDWSEDKTVGVVQSTQQQFPNRDVKLIELSKGNPDISGKKAAITQALSQAKGELIVTTDADCIVPKNWLRNIAYAYETHHPTMIVGPVDFVKKGSLFSKMQNLEFLGLVGSTGGTIAMNVPIMCNGANLAYQKKAFDAVNGFKGVDKMPSGDDVFLMLKLLKEYPGSVMFLKSRDAIVLTQPQENLRSFINQRKRWLSKRPGYKSFAVIAIAVLVYLANLACFTGFIVPFFSERWTWNMAFAMLIIKTLIDFFLLYSAAAWAGRKKLLIWTPIEEVLVILYVVLMGIFGNNGRYTWRGRKIIPKKS